MSPEAHRMSCWFVAVGCAFCAALKWDEMQIACLWGNLCGVWFILAAK